MNMTNALGSISAVVTVVLAVMTNVLGCTVPEGSEVAQCSASFLSPAWAGVAMVVFAGLTLVSKLARPGGVLRSLLGGTAVIVPETSPKSTAGTVTPEQAAQP